MARVFTPVDGHAIMNLMAKEATGREDLQATDASSFVSVGETVLSTGFENTLNALAMVLGRRRMAVRPYEAKLLNIQAIDTDEFTHRWSKISYYAKDNVAAGNFNTDLYTNLYHGYDNGKNGGASVGSMWEQFKTAAVEVFFGGQTVWDYPQTIYENQFKMAMRDEAEFADFVEGYLMENQNDIESTKEAFRRMALLNYIAGIYDVGATAQKVNLTAEYNAKFGTSYTSEQLRTTHLADFLAFFISVVKINARRLELRSNVYHINPVKVVDGVTYTDILRTTPKRLQKLMLYAPLFTESESMVLPQIFNDQYLKMENYEAVDFWQSIEEPASINFTPAVPDLSTGLQTAGSDVELDYVVGVQFDHDACMVDFQFESADTTPLEARKKYRNIWNHSSKNAINDFTENGIIYYMQDE